MDKVGIKILSGNDIPKCIKIVRKYCSLSIGQIKDSILENKYIIEGSYISENDIQLILKLYAELVENNIKAELYEHDRKTGIEFLENLVETYYRINEEINERME